MNHTKKHLPVDSERAGREQLKEYIAMVIMREDGGVVLHIK
jgi:hypothetical protein